MTTWCLCRIIMPGPYSSVIDHIHKNPDCLDHFCPLPFAISSIYIYIDQSINWTNTHSYNIFKIYDCVLSLSLSPYVHENFARPQRNNGGKSLIFINYQSWKEGYWEEQEKSYEDPLRPPQLSPPKPKFQGTSVSSISIYLFIVCRLLARTGFSTSF